MMAVSCLKHAFQACLLFLVNWLLVLPLVTCQLCNHVPQLSPSDPRIKISSSPSFNTFSVGVHLTLTCIASQNDELPKKDVASSRPLSIQWYNPQGMNARDECNAGSSQAATVMSCTLRVGPLTLEKFGNYTCRARSEYHCSFKRIEINFHEIQTPEIIKVPLNQSAGLGSNVTFNCTATGHPKPTVTWTKNGDLYSVQSNPRAKVIAGYGKGVSQLVIAGVTSEDYGEYHCVANNSAGVKISSGAFISPETGGMNDIQVPEIVEVPVNQTAAIGSIVTFNCSATGYPKPTITWTRLKGNETHSIQSNVRVKIKTDESQSLLVITGVTNEDYGKYQCVANSSAGVNKSQVVFLYPGYLELNPSRSLKPPMEISSNPKIITIVVPTVILVAIIICGLCGFRWCRRSRQTRDTDIPITSITCTDSVDRISLSCELTSSDANNIPLQENPGNAHNVADCPVSSISVQGPEIVRLRDGEIDCEENPLLPELRVDISARMPLQARQFSSMTSVEDTPPKRPPKPKRKDNTQQEVICSCTLQSRGMNAKLEKSDTLNSKDSGYDSAESTDSICIDQDVVLDSEMENGQSSQDFFEEMEEGWEVDVTRLEVFRDEVLGQGEFGIVYKGLYRREDGNVIDVAVKQLKDSTSATNKADLLSEIQILKQAGQHPNILNLIGACTQEENILVVTEFIPRGSLERLLKSKGERDKYANVNCVLNDRELLKIAHQIASGMQHLEDKKCIHRDLAARNIFIDDNNVAKVGDFGLARDISGEGIYTKTSNGKVPWRWSALESLRDGVYTSQSDVWSFGIVLWEITTYGKEPYPDITTPAALISFLSSGKRMLRPEYCPEELYTLMRSCWNENPLMRPTFAGITKQLQKYLLKEYKRTYVNIKDDGISIGVEV